MSTDYIRALPHPFRGDYHSALSLLAAQEPHEATVIAHIDSGVWPHPSLGWTDIDAPPDWLWLSKGRNFHDPEPDDDRPLARFKRRGAVSGLLEYPDHGVKTLSALCGVTDKLRGAAPGVRVVPYRVSNGPLFRHAPFSQRGGGAEIQGPAMRKKETARIGEAIDHALGLAPQPQVMTISMGNPGSLGIFQPVVRLLGGQAGMAKSTAEAVDRAYDAGVIICCAAGQIVTTMVYPAAFSRTVAVSGYDAVGTGDQVVPYPPGGYAGLQLDTLVDSFAQARRINRASFLRKKGELIAIHAEDDPDLGEPSGTSYACPQVAGAAALWRARHNRVLEGLFGRPGERWKIVEAFRHALRESGAQMHFQPPANVDRALPWPQRRTLDIPALLKPEWTPRADWPLARRTEAVTELPF